ncbi:helix-turn-helix domain-containing protein [Nonomuraea jiangxiensis]|uniref:MarR family protein n=1 Tax=Nonomuraea jiangxiensis TaxID=633440 RepID=A0A1G8KJN3_9ACTN|nr:MarR family protein [Nonomuraea jiangxiensis]
MPGGHLTYEDRRKIAEGLAEGLSYAEIARRLGRPRSTVGREIARNGGPHAYRAARAQQATGWRARRRIPPPSSPETAEADARDPQAVRELEQKLSAMLTEAGGVPAIAGKVLACLLTSDSGHRTVADLVERLQVSPASISKGVGWLDRVNLVRREREDRRERYFIDEDVWYRAWVINSRAMAKWADTTQEGVEILGANTPASARLRAASQFFRLLGRDMAQAAEHYRQIASGPPSD